MHAHDYEISPYPVRSDIAAAHRQVWEELGRSGTHWTGAERVAIAAEVRSARAERGGSRADGDGALPAIAVEAARAIAVDAARIDREWCRGIVDALGAGAYVELVAVVAQLTSIDAFGEALGVALEPLPPAQPGAAAAKENGDPAGIADIGAFVPMLAHFPGPNVGRALSLVPRDNQTFFALVGSMYALRDFRELVWDRPLSRPQVELVASRVSALNECFY